MIIDVIVGILLMGLAFSFVVFVFVLPAWIVIRIFQKLAE